MDVCNFTDDTTPFVCHENTAELLEKVKRNSELAIHWFEDNHMELNIDKCNLLIFDHTYEHQWIQICKDIVSEENEVILLGIAINNELKFDSHISNMCSKADKKLGVLCRFKNILTFQQ